MPMSVESLRSVVLEQLGEGVIVTDEAGHIVFVNKAAEVIHGRAQLEVPPDDYTRTYELLDMDGNPYPPESLPLARAVMKGERVENASWKIRRPDGSVVVAVGSARPLLDPEGRQVGAALTMRDETLRFEAEARLNEALHLKDILLAEVNHRVRNSLQIVSSIISLAAQRAPDDDTRGQLKQTRQRVDVISAIHRSLYEIGTHDRADCARLLPELCQQVVEAGRIDKEIAFEGRSDGEMVLAVGDAVSLSLAVTELVTNACKYAFEGRQTGKVELILSVADGKAQVDVCDDGVGLSATVDKEAGSGIGMKLISSLTRSIGAELDTRSGPDGTTHSLRFEMPQLKPGLQAALPVS